MTPEEFVQTYGRVFAPSGSSRWLFCTGSVGLEVQQKKEKPERKELPSIYASEGTAAHQLAARCVKDNLSPYNFINDTIVSEDEAGMKFVVDLDMANAVNVYVDYVLSFAHVNDDPIMEVEQRLDLTSVSPYIHSGTSDAWIYQKAHQHLHVFDYKHGKGIRVEVKNNTQLLIYGLGVFNKLTTQYGIRPNEVKRLTLHIVQPRVNNNKNPPQSWEISPDIAAWVHELIIKAIQQAFSPSPVFAPSENRCRWCPGSPCPAQAELALAEARSDFGHLVNYELSKDETSPLSQTGIKVPEPTFPDVQTLSKFELSAILKHANKIEAFLRRVGEKALQLQLANDRIPFFKLVRGRAQRRWQDETNALRTCRSLGIDDADLYTPPKFKSPSQIEQLLKAKKIDKSPIEPLIEKPLGEVKLAPIYDKRPEVSPETQPHHDFAEFKKLT